MYFTVSWDISANEPRWSQINGQMCASFKGLPNAHVMSTYYLVQASQAQRDAILENLNKFVDSVAEDVYFLLSPLFNPSCFGGRHEDWPKINQITGCA
jgi:hypothetical protein